MCAAPAWLYTCAAVLDSGGTASGSSKRGQTEAVGTLALPSKSGRELYITQQQSSKAFLLVLDLHSKQLLDVVRVSSAAVLVNRRRTCPSARTALDWPPCCC